MTSPIWLLDVDGVLNASRAGWGSAPHTQRVWADGHEYRLRWSPQLMQDISALSRDIDIRWATTWIRHHDELSRLFRLPCFSPAFELGGSETRSEVEVLKLRAALDVVSRGNRLIWTDDDAIPAGGPMRERLDAADSLLIAPKASRGLRREHIEEIRAALGQS